jgi:hypothetical protein
MKHNATFGIRLSVEERDALEQVARADYRTATSVMHALITSFLSSDMTLSEYIACVRWGKAERIGLDSPSSRE